MPIEQGLAHTVLPLISSSTNQHCTHQAALFFLAADYTGGIALASLISDWPVVGVHPIASSDKSMALWLVKGEVKYLRPSVGRLDVIAKVDRRPARSGPKAVHPGPAGAGIHHRPVLATAARTSPKRR